MDSHESLTPDQKAELHRTRHELGRQMARRLAVQSLYERHDTVLGREAVDLEEMRRAVWRAEYDAFQADPNEVWLPPDIRQERERHPGK